MQTNLADTLRTGSPESRTQAKERCVADLRSEFDRLVTLVAAERPDLEKKKRIDPNSAANLAVEILQFARYAPAAEICVRLLDVRSTAFPAVSDEMHAHFPYFPFAVAAAAIGPPALTAIEATLTHNEPSTTKFQLSCLVLKETLGEMLAMHFVQNSTQQEQKLEQASKIIQANTNAWEASFCSDYSPL